MKVAFTVTRVTVVYTTWVLNVIMSSTVSRLDNLKLKTLDNSTFNRAHYLFKVQRLN